MTDPEIHAFDADDWLARNLTPGELDQLRALAGAIAGNRGESLVAVVGSVARGRRTPTSDVDAVVIAENPMIPHGLCIDCLSVAFRYLDDFQHRLYEGESFAFCALRDARPVYDTGLLHALREFASDNGLTASPAEALQFARARLAPTSGDDVRAGARAVANVVLLSSGSLPLSGPELEAQLQAIGQDELSELVRQSRQSQPPEPGAIVARLREILAGYGSDA